MKDTEPLRAIIKQQTAEFLARGGKIQFIANGIGKKEKKIRFDFSIKNRPEFKGQDSE